MNAQPLKLTRHSGRQQGFTLIEVVIVIMLLGMISAVATRYMSSSVETAYYEQTKKEMEQLVFAIVGDPAATTSGARPHFGYVGDIGALPVNLEALAENPGGFTTWDGPYIALGLNDTDFKRDAWHADYVLTDTMLSSVGSGSPIQRTIISRVSMLLNNSVSGYVVDANHSRPGLTFKDSLQLILNYPNGAGGMAAATSSPSAAGNFTFTGIPIGNHTLTVIYRPDFDTVTYEISVTPGSDVKVAVQFPADLWL